MRDAVIVDAIRTPIGRNRGQLKDWYPEDLLGFVIKNLVTERHPDLDAHEIQDVIVGCVTQTGEQGLNIARLGGLNAGLPPTVPGVSLNRQCGSGLQSTMFAAQGIMAGMQELILAGGLESMTRVPMMSDSAGISETLKRLYHIVPQGISAELIAERWGQTRQELDEFSLRSHQLMGKATKEGYFKREILPIPVPTIDGKEVFTTDEGIRYDTSLEKLGKLRPAFQEGGVITAGNSSQISDGAGAVLIASQPKAEELGLKPRARFVSMAVAAVEPTIMLTAPMPASQKALELAKLTIDDMAFVEVNEAFAPVPLAFIEELQVDPKKVNPNGGAIAHGHPLGATGNILLTKALHELERIKKQYALVTLCIGFGQATAVIIERL